jgi:hypothetical protein
MRGLRGWVLAALIAIAIAAAAYLVQPHHDSPEHSSNSDAANGTSAARLFAAAMGHPADQLAGSFDLSSDRGLLFVFSPTSPYTASDAAAVMRWVREGGVLVYASEDGDPELDSALGVTRLNAIVQSDHATANPLLDGVTRVAGASFAVPLHPARSQVPILRGGDGDVLGFIQRLDRGTVVVLADPLELCNGYLDKLDNGRMLSDLLGLVPSGAAVGFDEYHHGLILSDFAPQAWVTTPWGAALLWLLVAIFAGLVLRGRRFGPLIPRPADATRVDAEWAVAVGELLRRSGGRAVTLGLLASASERSVAARTGLQVQPRDRFWNALYVRAPELATELADAERALYSATGGDAELLSAAQRLHRIAYPPTRHRPPANKESR